MDALEIFNGKMDTNSSQTKSNYVKVKIMGLYGQLTLWAKIRFSETKNLKKQALFYKRTPRVKSLMGKSIAEP